MKKLKLDNLIQDEDLNFMKWGIPVGMFVSFIYGYAHNIHEFKIL